MTQTGESKLTVPPVAPEGVDPVAWMVRNKRGENVAVHVAELPQALLAELNASALYRPYTLVPLYEHPSPAPQAEPLDIAEMPLKCHSNGIVVDPGAPQADAETPTNDKSVFEAEAVKAAHTRLLDLVLSRRYSGNTLQTAIRALIAAAAQSGVSQDGAETRLPWSAEYIAHCRTCGREVILLANHDNDVSLFEMSRTGTITPHDCGPRLSVGVSQDDERPRGAEIAALYREREAMRHVINWLLGEEGDFPEMPDDLRGIIDDGQQYRMDRGRPRRRPRLYWWRGALRDRWAEAISVGPDNPANLAPSLTERPRDEAREDTANG